MRVCVYVCEEREREEGTGVCARECVEMKDSSAAVSGQDWPLLVA